MLGVEIKGKYMRKYTVKEKMKALMVLGQNEWCDRDLELGFKIYSNLKKDEYKLCVEDENDNYIIIEDAFNKGIKNVDTNDEGYYIDRLINAINRCLPEV